jgi:hypothetical protein
MGLISKIEDKMSSNKGHSDTTKKEDYDSSSNSRIQHPVGTTGTSSQDYGSSTTGTHGSSTAHGTSGLTGSDRDGRDTYGSSTTHSGNPLTSSHNDGRDAYGSSTTHSGNPLTSSHNDGRDAYGSSNTHSGNPLTSSHNDGRDAYGSSTTHAGNPLTSDRRDGRDAYGSSTTHSGNPLTSSHNDGRSGNPLTSSHNDGRDAYGSSNTHSSNPLTSSHGDRRDDGLGHTTGTSVPNTGRTDLVGGTHGSSGHHTGSGPREPFDPYSSKGQTTAANASTGYPSHGHEQYGSGAGNTFSNDPNVPHRNREGSGIVPGSHPNAHNPSAIPTAGGQRVGSTDVNDPYSSSSTTHNDGKSHPIRDAAQKAGLAGGSSGHKDHGSSHNNPNDVSYMNRSNEPGYGNESSHHHNTPGMAGSTMGSGTDSSHHHTGPGGMTSGSSEVDPKKMSNAYEAGYRDGMKHAQEQMQGLNLGR